jgi:hypothetical protein
MKVNCDRDLCVFNEEGECYRREIKIEGQDGECETYEESEKKREKKFPGGFF